MTRDQLIKKHPELFLECIKEGINLFSYGITDINSLRDVEIGNEEIRRREIFWNTIDEEEHSLSFI